MTAGLQGKVTLVTADDSPRSQKSRRLALSAVRQSKSCDSSQGEANLEQPDRLPSHSQEVIICQGTKRFFKHFLCDRLEEREKGQIVQRR